MSTHQRSHECIEAFSFRVSPIVTVGSVIFADFAILDLEADLAIVEYDLDELVKSRDLKRPGARDAR